MTKPTLASFDKVLPGIAATHMAQAHATDNAKQVVCLNDVGRSLDEISVLRHDLRAEPLEALGHRLWVLPQSQQTFAMNAFCAEVADLRSQHRTSSLNQLNSVVAQGGRGIGAAHSWPRACGRTGE